MTYLIYSEAYGVILNDENRKVYGEMETTVDPANPQITHTRYTCVDDNGVEEALHLILTETEGVGYTLYIHNGNNVDASNDDRNHGIMDDPPQWYLDLANDDDDEEEE